MSIPNETIASLEAVLFACGGPVEAERLRELLALSPEELEEAAKLLEETLEDSARGISLIRVESAYQLCTKPFVA
ncbi:MAG: SMC-Scp complex subunit ScpB, partial [Clostridia bacterium]|nr:SMC-Scp complex subunit ScpB [Clostridia bacterium]